MRAEWGTLACRGRWGEEECSRKRTDHISGALKEVRENEKKASSGEMHLYEKRKEMNNSTTNAMNKKIIFN